MNDMELKELETSRLLLRKLCVGDLYDYYEHLMSDGDVMRYLPMEPHQDIGESLEKIQQTLDQYEEGGCWRWAIARKEDDGLIGTVELLDVDPEEKRCSVLCLLAKQWWGQGYATEALAEVLRYATEELGIRKITADHLALNAAAGAVMRKTGMTHMGIQSGRYEKHGQLHDAHRYELDLGSTEPLTANEYQTQAMTTLNPALTKQEVLLNGVMGLCGEAGECIDLVKKHLFQGHALDREKLSKELGDVAWYLAEAAWALDLKLEDVLRGNLQKLKDRYPQGFDSARSMNR